MRTVSIAEYFKIKNDNNDLIFREKIPNDLIWINFNRELQSRDEKIRWDDTLSNEKKNDLLLKSKREFESICYNTFIEIDDIYQRPNNVREDYNHI